MTINGHPIKISRYSLWALENKISGISFLYLGSRKNWPPQRVNKSLYVKVFILLCYKIYASIKVSHKFNNEKIVAAILMFTSHSECVLKYIHNTASLLSNYTNNGGFAKFNILKIFDKITRLYIIVVCFYFR